MSYIYGARSKARNANVVYIYTTLAFLALLGAPHIYDISSLRVKIVLPFAGTFYGNWTATQNLPSYCFLPCDFHLRRRKRQWRACSLNWQEFL